jgi:hypothetical protein
MSFQLITMSDGTFMIKNYDWYVHKMMHTNSTYLSLQLTTHVNNIITTADLRMKGIYK